MPYETRTINLGRITGQSAYEVAVKNGFEGTEEEWLESLKASASVNEKVETLEDDLETLEGTVETKISRPEDATVGNIAIFDINRNIVDGGIKLSMVDGGLRITYDDGK